MRPTFIDKRACDETFSVDQNGAKLMRARRWFRHIHIAFTVTGRDTSRGAGGESGVNP